MSLVPFGKYKGQPVEVLQNDRAYCEWLAGQDWFRTRFTAIHTLIINNFSEPTETPEHNALQARFLDPAWRERFVLYVSSVDPVTVLRRERASYVEGCKRARAEAQSAIERYRGLNSEWDIKRLAEAEARLAQLDAEIAALVGDAHAFESTVWFESRGADVCVSAAICDPRTKSYDTRIELGWELSTGGSGITRVECKPSLGDDYPAVLRQMTANKCHVLLIDAFTAAGATFTQVREIFKTRGIGVFTVGEVKRTQLLSERMA